MGSARQTLLVPTADLAPEVATVTLPSSTLSVSNGEDRSLHLSPTRADVLVPSTTGSSKKEAAADEHTAALLDGIDSLLSGLSSDEDDDEFSFTAQTGRSQSSPPTRQEIQEERQVTHVNQHTGTDELAALDAVRLSSLTAVGHGCCSRSISGVGRQVWQAEGERPSLA